MKKESDAKPAAPVNPPLKPFDSAKVVEFLGKARVEKINALCNGQFEPRLQQACKAAADLVQAVLLTLSACGVKANKDEQERLDALWKERPKIEKKAAPAALPEAAA